MTDGSPASLRPLPHLAGLVVGAALGWLVPLGSPTPPAPPGGPPDVAAEEAPVPRSAPAPDPPAPAPDFAAAERALMIARWGTPPTPAAARQPSEQELRDWLAEHTTSRLSVVDCATYPCVASLVGPDRDPDLRARLAADFPHARVMEGTLHNGRVAAARTDIAFLDRPVEGHDWIFSYRVMMAAAHRAQVEAFEGLDADAPEVEPP